MKNIAQNVIAKCGGHKKIAEWTGLSLASVYKWTYPAEKRGTGGVIPAEHQQIILRAAKTEGINLEPSDFFDI